MNMILRATRAAVVAPLIPFPMHRDAKAWEAQLLESAFNGTVGDEGHVVVRLQRCPPLGLQSISGSSTPTALHA